MFSFYSEKDYSQVESNRCQSPQEWTSQKIHLSQTIQSLQKLFKKSKRYISDSTAFSEHVKC